MALASSQPGWSVAFAAPAPGATNWLEDMGAAGTVEFADAVSDAAAFATNYPTGSYTLWLTVTNHVSSAHLNLNSSPLPSALGITSWPGQPFAVAGQPWTAQWDSAAGGPAVDYVRLCIEQAGTIVFATPAPGAVGALTGASKSVVVPGAVFTNPGVAEVSLTGFSVTGLNTNAIPGMTLRTAAHRTTTFDLRVVDGSAPPPLLLTTNLSAVPIGEPFLGPVFATNGVRPLLFDCVGGQLPPGLAVDSSGFLSGQATTEGAYDASLRVTDLLGRSATQSVHIVTVAVPPALQIQAVRLGPGATFAFDVAGAVGADCVVDRSTNLLNWAPFLTTNLATGRFTLTLPIVAKAAFFRVREPAPPFLIPNPLTVAPVLNTHATASAQLDPLGGSLSLTNASGYVFVLNVPAGALPSVETITMTDIAQLGGLPLSGGLRAAVTLEPEGLVFDLPARLDITAPSGQDTSTLMGFGSRTDGSQFALQPAFATNRTVSLHLWHFSLAGTGSGTAADAQAQAQNPPGDAMAALEQQMAATLAAGQGGDPSSLENQLVNEFIQMADQVVLPKLKQAVSDDSVVDDALGTWLHWLYLMELLGLDNGGSFGENASNAHPDLAKRVVRAGNLAAQALSNAIDRACERCLAHDLQQLGRMLTLAKWAGLLGLDFEEKFWSCARRCLVFELEVESEILDSQGSYSTHTKGKAKLRPLSDDPAQADWVRIVLMVFSGSGQWDITSLTVPPSEFCPYTPAPQSGRLRFPYVKISLFKERQVWVPGQGPVTTSVFAPDMHVIMSDDMGDMPAEHEQWTCKDGASGTVDYIFAPNFMAIHSDEQGQPTPLEAQLVGNGPILRITGFTPGGPDDVILTKAYLRTYPNGQYIENTLIQLHHTPQ